MSSTPRLRLLYAANVGHFGIDVFNSMGPVLLAFLKTPLGLSAGQVGLAVGLYQLLAGSTQPPFGWLVDRVGSRLLGPTSVTWTMGCLCLALVAAERLGFGAFLLIFGFAALGSGAFHPQGTMHAGTAIPGRSATGTSLFFLCGQVGLATGPPLAGFLLDRWGTSGILFLAAVMSPVPLFMAVAMGPRRWNPRPEPPAPVAATVRRRIEARSLGLLAAIFSLRAWIFIGTAAFLPLLFQLKGWSSTRQGLLAGTFWLGGAITGVFLGDLADRWGRRRAVSLASLIGAVLLPFLPGADGFAAFALALACGGCLGAPHSVLIVIAQDLLPVRRGLASGMALGFLFAMGAVASWSIGMLADRYGLSQVIQAGAVLAAAVAGLALLLPTSAPAEESARPADKSAQPAEETVAGVVDAGAA